MTPRNEETKQEEVPETGNAHDVGGIVQVGEDIEVAHTINAEEHDNGGDNDQEVGVEDDANKSSKQYVGIDAPWEERYVDLLKQYWPLGFIAFGGPSAHIAILREHLVERGIWLDEEQFLELFAIGQGLPGGTSTQLVVSTALVRAGPIGGLSALVMWNLPGLVILTTCGVLLSAFIDPDNPPFWLVGLPPAAISLVFKAFYIFTKNFDKLEACLALFSHLIAILINADARIPSTSSQYVFPAMLAVGGLVTYIDSRREKPFSTYKSPSAGWESESDATMKRIGIPLWVGGVLFLLWAVILVVSICLVSVFKVKNVYLEIFELMYRIGSIIFGGGQVVLPLLQDLVVPKWLTKDQFLQGLGLAQSVPGPLFNFAAYLGAVYQGVPGALVAFLGIFGPGIILIFAIVPFWARIRHVRWFKAVLKGVNATAIGLVGAACVTLWEAAITDAADAMVFSVAGFLAVVFDFTAPFVVLSGGVFGAILHQSALNLGQVPYCVKNGFVEG